MKQFQFIVLQAKDVLVRNIAIRRNFVKQHSKAKGNFELLYQKISGVLHFYRGIVCHTARVLTTLCHLLYCTSSWLSATQLPVSGCIQRVCVMYCICLWRKFSFLSVVAYGCCWSQLFIKLTTFLSSPNSSRTSSRPRMLRMKVMKNKTRWDNTLIKETHVCTCTHKHIHMLHRHSICCFFSVYTEALCSLWPSTWAITCQGMVHHLQHVMYAVNHS